MLEDFKPDEPAGRGRRRKLWEIDGALHCSLVGTCLALGDLRRIESRLHIEPLRGATAFKVHSNFVRWAGTPGPVAKQMHKILERRYAPAVRRYAAAADAAGVRALWTQSLEEGDIPGPYWALLTHPAADAGTVMLAFGEVHMLSHLVGAANRADIRRLMQLQEERDGLAEALRNAKRRIAEQDRDIRRLLDRHAGELRELSAQLSAAASQTARLRAAEERVLELEQGDAYRALQRQAESSRAELLRATCEAEASRTLAETLTRENAELGRTLAGMQWSLRVAAAECEAMELLLRDQLPAVAPEAAQEAAPGRSAIDLCGRRIVYVGGRGGVIPHLRAVVERAGGVFVHHDGGVEEQGQRLDALLGQCDAVFCPIDCVSHDACLRAKRACRQRAAAFVPLRTGSLSSFIRALRQLSNGTTRHDPAGGGAAGAFDWPSAEEGAAGRPRG